MPGAVRELARSIRVGEALLMMGFPVAGAVYGLPNLSARVLGVAVVALAAMVPIALSVYAWNALGGLATDRRDPKFCRDPRLAGRVSPEWLQGVAWAGLVVGTGLGLVIAPWFAACLGALWFLWYLYSRPNGMKSVPGAGTAAHLVGGALMCLPPYMVVRPLDERGLFVALILCCAFAAGHAHHEIMDRRTDSAMNVRTGAVAWGARRAVWLGLAFACASYAAACVAAVTGALSWWQAAPLVFAAPVHIGCGLRVLVSADVERSNRLYQRRYRLIFGGAIALSLVAAFVELAIS